MKVRTKRLYAYLLTPIFLINTSLYPSLASAQQLPPLSAQNQEVNPLEAGISQIENNDLRSQPNQKFDLFRLANQRIEIYNGQATPTIYNLNDYQVELPTLAYTQLKLFYNDQANELIIEATRGADDQGKNGTLVARQIITNLKLKSWNTDEELVVLFDEEGKLSAIDKNYITEQAFKSPIPVFQNLWKMPAQVSAKLAELKIRTSFLTRGTNPEILQNANAESVIPVDHEQKPYLNAGDIYLESMDASGKKTTVGVFSREVVYEKIIQDYKILSYMAALTNVQVETFEQVEGILKEIESNETKLKLAEYKEQMNPLFKQVLSQFRKDQIEGLLKRTGAIADASGRLFDPMSDTADWKKDFSQILESAQKSQGESETVKSAEEIEKDWFQYMQKAKVNADLIPKNATRLQKFTSTIKKALNLKTLGVIFSISSVAYLSLPFLHDAGVIQEQIKAISWFYQNAYPDILKDAVYRVPLLLSTFSLMAIWPVSVALSATAGKAFKQMSAKLGASDNSKFAKTVRDLARQWGDLNNWQRINSLGMRIYAYLIYPYWRVLVDLVLRQKTFFTALENGINPFEKILKDSALGKKLGIENDTRIGLNPIFAGTQKIDQRSHINLQLQSALKEQKNQREQMAWTLATAVAAEKYQIDPATLMMMAEEKEISLASLESVFNSPDKKQKWKLLADEINKILADMGTNSIVSDLTEAEMQDLYSKVSVVANKIMQLGKVQSKLRALNYEFKTRGKKALNALLMIGKSDFKFLKSIFTNEFVSKQVQQEFTIDHAMVVGIVAFYGDRANLAHPDQLAADPNGFLWTSRAHWYDVFLNTFAHFFISGASMALVFQKPKVKLSENYRPKENFVYAVADREQGFMSATYHWIKDVSNPIKADIGGVMIKRFFKRFTTFTAGLTMSVGLRTVLYSSQLGLAKAFLLAKSAWLFAFFAAQWFYGWIWDPVQRGNQLESERFAENMEKLKEAQFKLSRGNKTEGLSEMMALYIKENPMDLLAIQRQVLAAGPELIPTSVKKITAQESIYFGLLINLSNALSAKNADEIARAKSTLTSYLSKENGQNIEELKQLSAENLLKFSVTNPPIYTSSNKVLSWLTTSIGAVGSTILAIPLSVTLTNNELMADPMYLLKWIGISLSAYGISYVLLSKNMAQKYVNFYQDKVKPFLDKIKPANGASTKKISCEALLMSM